MTIGVLGGTFNPIHIGHLMLAQQVGSHLKFSKVLFMPSKIPPHKKDVISEEERFYMVQLAIKNNPFFEISRLELDRKGISYTINSIEILNQQYKEKIAFIIGSDNLLDITKWYQWKKLLEICDFAIGARPGTSVEIIDEIEPIIGKKKSEKFRKNFVPITQIDISASLVRKRYEQKLSNKYIVPLKVDEYILEKKLYR